MLDSLSPAVRGLVKTREGLAELPHVFGTVGAQWARRSIAETDVLRYLDDVAGKDGLSRLLSDFGQKFRTDRLYGTRFSAGHIKELELGHFFAKARSTDGVPEGRQGRPAWISA